MQNLADLSIEDDEKSVHFHSTTTFAIADDNIQNSKNKRRSKKRDKPRNLNLTIKKRMAIYVANKDFYEIKKWAEMAIGNSDCAVTPIRIKFKESALKIISSYNQVENSRPLNPFLVNIFEKCDPTNWHAVFSDIILTKDWEKRTNFRNFYKFTKRDRIIWGSWGLIKDELMDPRLIEIMTENITDFFNIHRNSFHFYGSNRLDFSNFVKEGEMLNTPRWPTFTKTEGRRKTSHFTDDFIIKCVHLIELLYYFQEMPERNCEYLSH